jgi:hypothetical protein
MLFEGNLRIMGRNILLKFFGRTTYNKEFIELRRYEKMEELQIIVKVVLMRIHIF